MEDAFAGLEAFSDDEEVSAQDARAERIAAARKAAQTYSAKIEEPQWFLSPDLHEGTKGSSARHDLFVLHQLYLDGQFSAALEKALSLIQRDQKKGSADDVELVDLALRSAIKCGKQGDEVVLDLARGYKARPTHPSLALSASRILSAAPQSLVQPTEALEAILAALTRHSTLNPYLLQLSLLLKDDHPTLDDVLVNRTLAGKEKEVEAELDAMVLSEQGRRTMERVLGFGGETEEEEEQVRDVRSL